MKKLWFSVLLFSATSFGAPASFAKKYPMTDTAVGTSQDNDMSRNMNSILQYQEEQRARQKKAAMIRIGIGVALLVVLVVGIRRRRKK